MKAMNMNDTKRVGKRYGAFPVSCATREMVHARTSELATLAGRRPYEIIQRDYEQAKRELTGERDFDKQEAILHLNGSRKLSVRS